MTTLSATRCFRHGSREAIGLCVTCKKFYCRECLVVLEGKLTCSNCIVVETEEVTRPSFFKKAFMVFRLGWGIFVLWFLFYCVGRVLLAIPDMFHASFLS